MSATSQTRKHAREEGEAEPLDVWTINGIRFETFDQGNGECAVRMTPPDQDGNRWITHPTKHYETEAGARYAILLYLEMQGGN